MEKFKKLLNLIHNMKENRFNDKRSAPELSAIKYLFIKDELISSYSYLFKKGPAQCARYFKNHGNNTWAT